MTEVWSAKFTSWFKEGGNLQYGHLYHSFSLLPSELACLAELKMKFIHSTLEQFKEWIESGLYDFYALPIGMKKHLKPDDKDVLEKIPMLTYYKGKYIQIVMS